MTSILNGRLAIRGDTALGLVCSFGTSPEVVVEPPEPLRAAAPRQRANRSPFLGCRDADTRPHPTLDLVVSGQLGFYLGEVSDHGFEVRVGLFVRPDAAKAPWAREKAEKQ